MPPICSVSTSDRVDGLLSVFGSRSGPSTSCLKSAIAV
jgi:hypothetical protein